MNAAGHKVIVFKDAEYTNSDEIASCEKVEKFLLEHKISRLNMIAIETDEDYSTMPGIRVLNGTSIKGTGFAYPFSTFLYVNRKMGGSTGFYTYNPMNGGEIRGVNYAQATLGLLMRGKCPWTSGTLLGKDAADLVLSSNKVKMQTFENVIKYQVIAVTA